MAEKGTSSSESDCENRKMLCLGNPGHTMSDSSSSESDEQRRGKVKNLRKKKVVPKVVLEKRPKPSSSDESDKESKKPRSAKENLSSQSDGGVSPLYQNQQGHPDYPFGQSDSDRKTHTQNHNQNY